MNTIKKAVASILLIGIVGCANRPFIPAPTWLIFTVRDMYVGRPLQDIVAKYGAPDAQQDFQGEKIHIWHANTTWGITEVQSFHCKMNVYVRPDGIIRTIDFVGQMGACKEFNP
ncbi:MAG: hypothetical protein IT472_11880 [Thermomonas sp.]|uniref:hypothetical protein n=1 Tax=Thermomonas sp. TaxID=1971895 RepID=UPI002625244E|nr:hypothetical protein [Thermomonas sp.]MCC7097861.1 hypothetical protein [Thermomonas sp.]